MAEHFNSPEFEGITIPSTYPYSYCGEFATIKPIEFDGFAFKGGVHGKN